MSGQYKKCPLCGTLCTIEGDDNEATHYYAPVETNKDVAPLNWLGPFELLGGNIRWAARVDDVVFSITKLSNKGGYKLGAELEDGNQNKAKTLEEAKDRIDALRAAIIHSAKGDADL